MIERKYTIKVWFQFFEDLHKVFVNSAESLTGLVATKDTLKDK